MMTFKTFIVNARENDFWQEARSFCFRGQLYPGLFFTTLFSYLNKKNYAGASYKKISIEEFDQKAFYATFSQSILGMNTCYWLGDSVQNVNEKKRKEYGDYFARYQGPHTVVFFVESNEKIPSNATCTSIVVEHVVDYATACQVVAFFECALDARRMNIMKKVFEQSEVMSLDAVCLLMHYLELLPNKAGDDAADYVMSVLGTAPALSALSEAFFAKNSQRFFSLWSTLEKDYPDIFWIMFWSEHVWRAYHVLQFLHDKNFVQAKRMSFRLPYSFINKDWQKNSLPELACAYQNLYSIDFALKKGSNFTALDLFYVNYFNGKFAGL